MRASDVFPSNFLKAADLQDKHVTLTIKDVVMETLGTDRRPVMYFQKTDKGMVLNKTNFSKIAGIYGDETDDWIGQKIVLFPAMVDFKGDTVAAIRVQAPPRDRAPQRPTPPPADSFNDEVPF